MITRYKFLRMVSFGSAVLMALPHLWAAPKPTEQPNIIFIMADDHCNTEQDESRTRSFYPVDVYGFRPGLPDPETP